MRNNNSTDSGHRARILHQLQRVPLYNKASRKLQAYVLQALERDPKGRDFRVQQAKFSFIWGRLDDDEMDAAEKISYAYFEKLDEKPSLF